ncbi:hypothetical protein M407DRAFT_245488 [Tulasnella calospora MUT 4182]|uniref:WLM domain-containing protein n=1 Tax=Tulasnella calospora MUT 4182 TaxID=1051891 RepID=A0A0C3KIY1_9AGAM|nr:hypothetical protein M407DRAFT_245488 [Tulasnella calospora MUT 4182]
MSSNVFVQRFMHLKEMPREKEALAILQKVASLVKPIMRKHGWVLPVLAEFYPENPGLLGLDINGGQKICVRLRPYFDKGAFLREEEIIGTMLHELTHNVHGPHDQQFYKFLSKLEDEYDALQRSGYAGEGFFSRGTRLGQGVSHNPSPRVARERALAAAEKRRQIAVVMNAGNKTLGGSSREGKSMRQLVAEAAERRVKDEKSCAFGRADAEAEAERATQWSVVDDAWDDSDDEIILLDGPPEGVVFERSGSRPNHPSQPAASSSKSREVSCPACTFLNPPRTKNCEVCDSPLPSQPAPPAVVAQTRPQPPAKKLATKRTPPAWTSAGPPQTWDCPTCTLTNPIAATHCAVCEHNRPNMPGPELAGWTCLVCGTEGQDHQFWTCRECGFLKESSAVPAS